MVELIDVNALQPQPFQAAFDRLSQMRWSCIVGPLVRSRPIPPSLRRNHQIFGIGVQCFCDDFLVHVGAVGIRGVNEIHLELGSSTQDFYRLWAILRRSPNTLSREAHRPKPEPIDRGLTTK